MADDHVDKVRKATLQFHYIKGRAYQETACHGAIGGVTPQGKLWMAFFSERGPLPRVVEFEVDAQEGTDTVNFNELSAVPSRIDSRPGIVRHVELSTYMDLDVATRVHKWMGDRISELQEKVKK